MTAAELFAEIDAHLMGDDRPSVYLRRLYAGGALEEGPYTIFRDMANTAQNPKHHPEGDVFTHTLLVVDQAAGHRRESRAPRVLMWAALLHDVGKPETSRVRQGRITAYNHDIAGEVTARKFLEAVTDDRELIDGVAALTRWHMQPFLNDREMGRGSLEKLREQADYREVALLSRCDRMGRYGVDERAEQMTVDRFLRRMENLPGPGMSGEGE